MCRGLQKAMFVTSLAVCLRPVLRNRQRVRMDSPAFGRSTTFLDRLPTVWVISLYGYATPYPESEISEMFWLLQHLQARKNDLVRWEKITKIQIGAKIIRRHGSACTKPKSSLKSRLPPKLSSRTHFLVLEVLSFGDLFTFYREFIVVPRTLGCSKFGGRAPLYRLPGLVIEGGASLQICYNLEY